MEGYLASANWGTKRRCASCGAAFYDLNRAPITCPKCQSAYVAAPRLPIRTVRARTVEPVQPEPVEADAFEEDEVLEHTDDAEESEMPPDMEGEDDELRE
jgi:uncharacterized protein (TIGR02300 family)